MFDGKSLLSPDKGETSQLTLDVARLFKIRTVHSNAAEVLLGKMKNEIKKRDPELAVLDNVIIALENRTKMLNDMSIKIVEFLEEDSDIVQEMDHNASMVLDIKRVSTSLNAKIAAIKATQVAVPANVGQPIDNLLNSKVTCSYFATIFR